MVGDRMSESNQILSSFEMKINGKGDDEMEDGEIAEYLGRILAAMDSSLDQPFKDWIATRNAQMKDPTVRTSEEFEQPEIGRRQQQQVISKTKVVTQKETNELVSDDGAQAKSNEKPAEKTKPEEKTAEKSQNERIAKALKRYKQMKSGRDSKARKKMKLDKVDTDNSDESSDSEVDSTRTSGAQRGDLRLQKEKIKETENAVKKWRQLKNQIKNKN